MDFDDLYASTGGFLAGETVDRAITHYERKLSQLRDSRFSAAAGRNLTNDPAEIAQDVLAFHAQCRAGFPVKAVYLEMNGFDINTDRWYYDSFAYDTYGGDDLDWLSTWSSDPWPDRTLLGLEAVQAEYDWYSNHEGYKVKAHKSAEAATMNLVILKFIRLIRDAVALSPELRRVPVLATAHDCELLGRFLP